MKKELLQLFIIFVCYQGIFAQNFAPEGMVNPSKLEVLDKKWMPKYLNTTKFNDGTKLRVIHALNDSVSSWNTWSSNTEEPAVFIDNETGLHLYSLSAVNNVNLCPTGYRVPQSRDLTSFSRAISRKLITEYNSKEICYETDPDKCASTAFFKLYSRQMQVISLTNRIENRSFDENDVGVFGTYIQFDSNNNNYIERPTCNGLDKGAYTVLCVENDSTRYNFDKTYSYANLLNSVSVNFIKKYVIENNVNWLKSSNVKPEMIKIFFDENGINLGEAQTFSLPSTHYNFNRFIKSKESIYFTNDFSNLFDKSGKFYSLNKYSNFKEIPELKNFDITYKENQLITNVILTNGDKYSNILNYTNNIEISPFGGASKALLSFSPFHSGINDVGKHCGSYNLETYNNYKKRYKVFKSSFLFSTLIAGATSFGFYNYGYKRNPYSQFSKTYYSISNMSNKVWPICLSGLFLSTCIDVLHTYLIGKKNEMNYRKYKREIESMELYSNNFLHSGKSSDFDLDGVPDVFDECPKLIGPFENNGCPLDNDLDDDGVLNNLDICPEDFGPASNYGCPEQEELVEFPDVEASFPGGEKELQKFLSENVKFPEDCMDMDAQGRVFMKFTVEKDGSITNITVEANRTGCDEFVKEATRVLNKMPKWIPGEVGGESKRTTCRLPFNFKIN